MADGDDPKQPIKLFYSYSHKDEDLRDRLHDHLAVLRWNGTIADWHDRKIPPGAEWEDAIDGHLTSADIVLLLVSASFIASAYCWGKEMTKAMERHERGEARVIPIILKPCRFLSTPFAKLQALPKDGKPVTAWADQDEALDNVVAGIERVVEELRQQRAKGAAVTESTVKEKAEELQLEPKGPAVSESEAKRPEASPSAKEPATVAKPAAPAVIRETADITNKHGSSHVHIGVDPRTLPDLAVFKDVDAPWCPEMVVIPAGSFMMGSPEWEEGRSESEGPQHRVTIGYRFALGRYAVTFDEYNHFCAATKREPPRDRGWGRGGRPVINVSWSDAQDYVRWLSKETGQSYRLPSEAEWEYAARAGTTTPFSFGAKIGPKQVNFDGTYHDASGGRGRYRRETVAVGSLSANSWGLHEMHGNVWEWCEDVWHGSYEGAPVDGSAWTGSAGAGRVLRGGSWYYIARHVRSAYRGARVPGYRSADLGFRCARVQGS